MIPCQTVLLFPYVTNVTGYETGIAIDNTSLDPFQTPGSTGACNMYFYGSQGPTPGTAITLQSGTGSTSIAPGQQIAATASSLGLNGFSGYAFAVCNFQFAHGFAFVQTSKQTLGMGYLPLVLDTTGSDTTRGETLLGESLKQ